MVRYVATLEKLGVEKLWLDVFARTKLKYCFCTVTSVGRKKYFCRVAFVRCVRSFRSVGRSLGLRFVPSFLLSLQKNVRRSFLSPFLPTFLSTLRPLVCPFGRSVGLFVWSVQVGWITVLDSVPDINMIDWLPEFLDGLLNMLSDGNREIRQAADTALSDFLK